MGLPYAWACRRLIGLNKYRPEDRTDDSEIHLPTRGPRERDWSAMKIFVLIIALMGGGALYGQTVPPAGAVFLLMLENGDWASIKGNPLAPFINNTLLPMSSYCEQYYGVPNLHPSLPNYLWLEAGTNFNIFDDADPSVHHQNTTNHLVALLDRAGLSWKAYQEDIDGLTVPLVATNLYVPKHDPVVYFDDVTGTNDAHNAYGIAHIRPYIELARDLASNQVARYNFITPNLCHDKHDCTLDVADAWLAQEIPQILGSSAYQSNGVLFIAFDEDNSGANPLMMFVLSPLARGGGYHNWIHYDASSILRTLQEMFRVGPYLGAAAQANDLADLFGTLPVLVGASFTGGGFQFEAFGVVPNTTNIIEWSPDLSTWKPVTTNTPGSNSFPYFDPSATNSNSRFYRLQQLPLVP